MTNPPVLLEYVPLVRRLLAASEDPHVARVGRLGEIRYLVDGDVTQVDLEIIDTLMASESCPPFARRGWQEQRDALRPYVGKRLLTTGMQYASRQHEIRIDPDSKTVVYLLGFRRSGAMPEELAAATPVDQARWILEHPGDGYWDDGQRVVELLSAGRDASELSSDELLLLAKGYNWWGQNGKAFETAKLALTRTPQDFEWLSLAQLYARNEYVQNVPGFLTACDGCIVERVGPAAFWHLLKADWYIDIATGEFELEDYQWLPGHPIRHPELLRPAAEAMDAALACEPRIRDHEAAPGWVGDWNQRFAAVVQSPAFGHLAQ